jgi:hypothetical protein
MHQNDSEVKEIDVQEASQGKPLSRRQHRLMRRHLGLQLIQNVFGEDGLKSTAELTADEITKRAETFLILNRENLKTFLGWRPDQSHNSVPIVRWVLDQVGVKLASRQITRGGQRFMIYF